MIDFAPDSEWPAVDRRATEERYFVLSGEIIDGEDRYRAGTYVMFAAGSEHRPRSESGGRMLGINQVRARPRPGATGRTDMSHPASPPTVVLIDVQVTFDDSAQRRLADQNDDRCRPRSVGCTHVA